MSNSTNALVAAAKAARRHAYAPYSRFAVGAALECEDGEVFSGCNVENAAYPVGVCAERAALAAAVARGKRRFRRLAVVADSPRVCVPCGMCRQALAEFGTDLEVIMANVRGDVEVVSLAALLPRGFSAGDLPGGEG